MFLYEFMISLKADGKNVRKKHDEKRRLTRDLAECEWYLV